MKILAIAWKDTLVRFSDRTELLFFLILPLIFTVLLSGMGAGGNDDAGTPLLVVDQDQSTLSAKLVAGLQEIDAVEVYPLTGEQAENEFADQDAPAWLTIPDGFEADLLAGEPVVLDFRKLPNNASADAVQRVVSAEIGKVTQAIDAARASVLEAERSQPFASDAERQAYFEASLDAVQEILASVPQRVEIKYPEVVDENVYDSKAQASSGQLITWVFIPLLGASGVFAFERQQKTLPRLMTTPVAKSTYLLGVITGQLGAGIVQMILLIGFGALVMGVNYGQSPAGLAVLMLAFGLASVAFGTMLGTFVKTEKQAGNISIMLGMVMSLLGGCWWPLELFPGTVRTAVMALPTTWAMQGFTVLTMRGGGFIDALPIAGVLVGFACLLFVIGIWRFRYE